MVIPLCITTYGSCRLARLFVGCQLFEDLVMGTGMHQGVAGSMALGLIGPYAGAAAAETVHHQFATFFPSTRVISARPARRPHAVGHEVHKTLLGETVKVPRGWLFGSRPDSSVVSRWAIKDPRSLDAWSNDIQSFVARAPPALNTIQTVRTTLDGRRARSVYRVL